MKPLARQMSHGKRAHAKQAADNAPPAEQLPAPIPIHSRRRLFEPDVVMVDHAPCGEDHGESVDHQCRVEVLQVPRTHHNCRDQQRGPQRGPCSGLHPVRGPAQIGRQRDVERLLSRARKPCDWPTTRPGGNCQQGETRPDGPGLAAEECQQQRREEAAEPSHGADQSRDRPGLSREILRNQLENRTIP